MPVVYSESSPGREELILAHLPQVQLLAYRLHCKCPREVELDDRYPPGPSVFCRRSIGSIPRVNASSRRSLNTASVARCSTTFASLILFPALFESS